MIAFLKAGWKLLMVVKDGLVLLLLLLFFGALFAALSMRPAPHVDHDGALVLALDGYVVEQKSRIDPMAMLSGATPVEAEYALHDILRALDTAAADDRVKAVVLDLDFFLGGGQTSLDSIGARLDKVRKAGKPVLAYAHAYTNDSYALAAHASEIWADPMGGAMFAGPGGSNLYFRDLIDRLGVTAHIYRVGTFKSAVEPFLRADQSPEAEAAERALYGELWANWLANVARLRPKARIAALAGNPADMAEAAKGNLAQMALNAGIVDRLGSREAFGRHVATIAGADSEADGWPGSFAAIEYEAWLAANPPTSHGAEIGVLTIAGEIVDGEAGPGSAGGDTIAATLYDALQNRDLKALVVRVDSPGGSVLASEQIRRAIAEVKAQGLPVIVSMGDVAASGGYWVSTPADVIFAQPSTVTGSIGIFAVLPSFEKTLAKWGVGADGIRTTPLSGQPDLIGGFSPEFDRIAQAAIEHGYADFLARVAQARKMPVADVDRIAQGRVWAGGSARRIGLVDRFGGLDAALAEAAQRAGLKPGGWHPVWLEPEEDSVSALIGALLADDSAARLHRSASGRARMDLFARARAEQIAAMERGLALVASLGRVEGAQARCLECPVVRPLPSQQQQQQSHNMGAAFLSLFARP